MQFLPLCFHSLIATNCVIIVTGRCLTLSFCVRENNCDISHTQMYGTEILLSIISVYFVLKKNVVSQTSYQVYRWSNTAPAKLIKMRAELANLHHCAVPFLSRAAASFCLYYISVLFMVFIAFLLNQNKAHCLNSKHPAAET